MHIKGLIEKHIDGIVYISGQNEIKNINEIRHIPVVYIDRAPLNAKMLILSDNQEGGYLATKEMIDKGCRQILLLRDVRCASTIRYRKEGYIRALKENGISLQGGTGGQLLPGLRGGKEGDGMAGPLRWLLL